MNFFVLTNNPMVHEKLAPGNEVVFETGGIRSVFEEAARLVAKGHHLLSHPLSGSVKPGETPYKSMLVAREASQVMDAASARLVASALDACDKFADKTGSYDEQTLCDLQLVDYSLIEGALRSARVN